MPPPPTPPPFDASCPERKQSIPPKGFIYAPFCPSMTLEGWVQRRRTAREFTSTDFFRDKVHERNCTSGFPGKRRQMTAEQILLQVNPLLLPLEFQSVVSEATQNPLRLVSLVILLSLLGWGGGGQVDQMYGDLSKVRCPTFYQFLIHQYECMQVLLAYYSFLVLLLLNNSVLAVIRRSSIKRKFEEKTYILGSYIHIVFICLG